MEGSDDNASESSRRWTCSACGCNTNTESDRNCTICGTSNGTSSAFVDSHQHCGKFLCSVVAAYVGQYQIGSMTSFEKFSSVLVVFLLLCSFFRFMGNIKTGQGGIHKNSSEEQKGYKNSLKKIAVRLTIHSSQKFEKEKQYFFCFYHRTKHTRF